MIAEERETSAGDDPLGGVSDEQWQRLSRATILFSHHSVGRNILSGVSDIAAERSALMLSIAQVEPGDEPDGPGLFHFSVGANGDPASKLEGFARMMSTGLGSRADLALCKLCYADIGPGVAADPVFEIYRSTLTRLRDRHPSTIFIHPTIPLKTAQGMRSRARGVARRLLGQPAQGDPNQARNRYNELIRSEYAADAPIFDIARLESTRADGSRSLDPRGPGQLYTMAPEWTSDGGHLDERGRRHVASAFLSLLARQAP